MNNVFLGQPSQNIIDWIKRKSKQFLWFSIEEDGATIQLKINGPEEWQLQFNLNLEISRDNMKTWTPYDGYNIGDPEKDTVLKAGDRVYIRATDAGNHYISYLDYYYTFIIHKKVGCHGNIQCLLDKFGRRLDTPAHCYKDLFYNCTSLTQAPELPATQLNEHCYAFMFYNCTSLTQAPELPATQVEFSCYMYMFSGCTKLSSINVSFLDWNQISHSTERWVENVAANGTFTCPSNLPQQRGADYIPNNWTIVTK